MSCEYVDAGVSTRLGGSKQENISKKQLFFGGHPTNDMGKQVAGSTALSGMDLLDADKVRIAYLLEHPDEEDAILNELLRKYRQEDSV